MEEDTRVVIYIQPGTVQRWRQEDHCLRLCARRGWRIAAIAPAEAPADAVHLVTAGHADLIVTAYAARPHAGDLRDLAAAADVRVEYVRAPATPVAAVALIRQMYAKLSDVDALAALLGMPASEVRAALAD